jgi:plastocyanin
MSNRLPKIIACIAAAFLVSCGGGTEDPTPDTNVATVTVTGAATLAPSTTSQLAAIPRNAAGTAITGLTASWSSSVTSVATVSAAGLVSALTNGSTTITATVSGVNGTRLVSVQTITPVASATVNVNGNAFSPSQVNLTVGGAVTWTFNDPDFHNVTFGGTAGSPANIGDTQSGGVQRTFGTAGSFSYSCTRHAGMNGTVVVQ